jgi:sugar phosphate isomerase/epimerase
LHRRATKCTIERPARLGPRSRTFLEHHCIVPREASTATPSRRDFLAAAGASAAALAAAPLLTGRLGATLAAAEPLAGRRLAATYPVGLELYSVRRELARDLPGTLKAVADIGYKVVEFYAPYLQWTLPYAKDVRTQLDDLGLRCYSTHNSSAALMPGDTMTKAIELNQILGARHIIMASPPPNTSTLEDWTRVSGQLAVASKTLEPHGLFAGFHNHRIEWTPLAGGKRVMDVLASNTPKEFVLQFDVGTCLEAGADPIAWIKANPGRIRSVHLKDWAPGAEAQEKGYRVLFGEGVAPWKDIFAAVESTGGVEFYLLEQEGSRYSELDTAKRCLSNYKSMRGTS